MALRLMLLIATVIFIGAAAAPAAEAQLLRLIRINGTVPCSTGLTGNIATAKPFPNANVQLRCGNSVVSSTTTNNLGVFTMFLNPITGLLSSLVTDDCKVVVDTPLAACDASLAAGGILESPLRLITGVVSGILGLITDLIPTGFSLIN